MANSQQSRSKTPEENFRELYKRTAELNDKVSALINPAWGSGMGLLPTNHPLYRGEKPSSAQEEQGAPVDWKAIAERRERDLKKVDMARHLAEQERDKARQWARHGYEIGQRHCGWSDHGVAPAWLTEGWPPHIDSCEHLKQAAEFDEALTRVRALHRPVDYNGTRICADCSGYDGDTCDNSPCGYEHCPTLAALDGIDQPTGCRCHNGDELCSGCHRCPDICHGCDGPEYQPTIDGKEADDVR